MRKVTEYERTCRRDNTVWYVPEPLREEPKLPKLGSATQSGQIAYRGALILACIQASRCPTCGSISFSEREVKEAS